jgi:hypothetical protein
VHTLLDSPPLVFITSLGAQLLAAYIGHICRPKGRAFTEAEQEDFDVVRASALTLLALIIGFSFSMAVSRYDQRRNYEEAEANAIGTEYLRADLLPAEEAASLRAMLSRYLDQRIAFYTARDRHHIEQTGADTAKLQAELWSAVSRPAKTQPSPVMALAVSGMNDALNSQSYTQASWWNRIPVAAWELMGLIAIACNFLIGFGHRRKGPFVVFVFPILISISLLLIADMDSPRGGLILVPPQNLIALSQSIKAP